ncbi:tetratricopeptide repeat protein 19 homolog, mitochondrial isoform X1 [Leptopilina heterotoma]|uniref:tetratricopeptide repeat protein 19 homolog, mitochondrial isoform X1 n=3 Tax=Leptopilina heterotoma TaxID=63436 RepID=UPI001CA90721|nr:tetratricopeptide repeat protein 19 homolog, mitochondrial isoform X1 [Leptopilina heterotoma]
MSSVNILKTVLKLCPRFVEKICLKKHYCIMRKFSINRQVYCSYFNNNNLHYNNCWKKKMFIIDNNGESRKSKNSYFIMGGIYTLFGLFKEKEEKEEEPEYITAMKRSILAMQRGEFKKAEQMLHLALHMAQTIDHFKAQTYIFDLMANLAFEMGDFEKAEKLFVTVMQRLISTGTAENDLRIVHMSLKLSKIYEAKGQLEKAEDGYKFCLHALKENPNNEETKFFLLMTLDYYAHLLIEKSKELEAYKMLLQAYELSIPINGIEHEQTITILNDLGTIECRQGNYNLSIQHLNEALKAAEKLEDFESSALHINLGFTYLKQGLYEEAKKSCKEGQIIARMIKNSESLNEANVCLEEIKNLSKRK